MSVEDLNNFESAIGHEGVEMLSVALTAYPRVGQFLNTLRDRYTTTEIGQSVFSIAEESLLFDPKDGQLGKRATVSAFVAGGLLGTHVVYNFLSSESRKLVCDVDMPIHTLTEGQDKEGIKTDLMLAVVDYGQRGYDNSPAYHELFDDYKDDLSPSRKHQAFTRVGFGIVLNQIHGAHSMARLLDAEELSAELEWAHSVNYEAEFLA